MSPSTLISVTKMHKNLDNLTKTTFDEDFKAAFAIVSFDTKALSLSSSEFIVFLSRIWQQVCFQLSHKLSTTHLIITQFLVRREFFHD